MTKKYASSFAQFMNEAQEKKAQGLLEFEETGTLIDKIKDKANVRETDKLKIYSKEELVDMADSIDKKAWAEGLFSKKAEELADERIALNDERKAATDDKTKKGLLTQLLILSQAEMTVRTKSSPTITVDVDDDESIDDILPGADELANKEEENDPDLAEKGKGGLTQDKKDADVVFGKSKEEDETIEDEDNTPIDLNVPKIKN
jgi:hypothetical protein